VKAGTTLRSGQGIDIKKARAAPPFSAAARLSVNHAHHNTHRSGIDFSLTVYRPCLLMLQECNYVL